MKKIYLVDSENVGDVWVPLLVTAEREDHVIVFYTQKSPHMSYENVRMLKETEREAEFIKCFEGNNALDFQLVSELGYRLNREKECEYVIVSNDTGFDAVVRYWTRLGMPVSRLSGKECHKQVTEQSTVQNATEDVSDEESQAASENLTDNDQQKESETSTEGNIQDVLEQSAEGCKDVLEQSTEGCQDVLEQSAEGCQDVLRELCCCIGKDNLADIHNALVMLLGEDAGKAKYQELKSRPEYTSYWKELPVCSQEEKFNIYSRLVFAGSEIAEEDIPQEFAGFLWKAGGKRKNLNSLRAALQGHYGKEKGMKYYSLFKSHIKIMNRM